MDVIATRRSSDGESAQAAGRQPAGRAASDAAHRPTRLFRRSGADRCLALTYAMLGCVPLSFDKSLGGGGSASW